MDTDRKPRMTPLIAFVIVSLAVVGYFTGIQAPMSSGSSASPVAEDKPVGQSPPVSGTDVIPATSYLEMVKLAEQRRSRDRLSNLKSSVDKLAKVEIKPGDKIATLLKRSRNRAFNGAPPTIPHPIEQRSDASCAACHQKGMKTTTLRIPRMSHQFLANCTQCHVESNPKHMKGLVFRENAFTGLEAPRRGWRAFQGAPPQIPHFTWMRSDCMSCHGYAGAHGIRTTHPWRRNCQQCHTASFAGNQSELATEPKFLPGPSIER